MIELIDMRAKEMTNELSFSKKNANVTDDKLTIYKENHMDEISRMNQALNTEYSDEHCSIYLPFDDSILKEISYLVEKKQSLHPEYIIVVGIGGSNLGTIAVQEAVLGKMYNQKNPKTKIVYADTVDSDQINDIIELIEPVLKNDKNIIICGISKSGGTTETIANFEVLIDILERYKQNPEEYVVTITDKDSKFWHLAKEKRYSILEIPKKVGGRFSVFSPVGLFPLAMIGINVTGLIAGAKEMVKRCLNNDINDNPAAMSAALIYHHYLNKKNIHDLFLFNTDFESIGKWYRQLMAESIGKEFNRDEERIFTGITPTVSIGSIDLHSMAQLYLGGPNDKFTTFVHVDKDKNEITLPNIAEYNELVKGIQSRKMKEIMDAIFNGTKNAFEHGKRPFIEINLPDKSEESIGQFLQMKMMEMMFLGALMGVNTFDQPNVEAYKIETRKILEAQY